MAIPTSRTREAGRIYIDDSTCNGCGLCVEVCKDFDLVVTEGKVTLTNKGIFGCIACGHCMAVCPKDAIHIEGRFLSKDDLFTLPDKKEAASYEAFVNLLKRRRSMREFKDREVEPEMIQKIIEAARSAPMGLPPSDVNILVMDSREKVRRFSEDYCHYLESLKWFVSKWFLLLARPFWGKENDELFRKFLRPLIYIYTDRMKKGEDVVTYNAPAALYFYGSPYTDPADPLIPATYAMLAAESLGLGTCMLGGIHPFIQSGKAARMFREKQGIRFKSREGIVIIIGYPRIKFQSGIRRTFANVDYMN